MMKSMLLNSTKMMMMIMLITSIMLAISTNSWITLWMMMEINMMSFIPILSMNNMINSESTMKYFLIQSITSMILLMSIIILWLNNNSNIKSNLPINLSLMMKLGSAPFHWWFIQMAEKLNMINLLTLSTLQKIIPLTSMFYMNQSTTIYLMIIMNTIMGSINGINQTSMYKIITYSSVNHIGWMTAAMMINQNSWKLYFTIYSMMMTSMIMMTHISKTLNLYQMINLKHNNINLILFSMNLLSMGGLPPMTGFLPKWMIIMYLSMNSNIMILSIMMITSIITLYFYIKIIYSMLLLNNTKMKWMKQNSQNPLNSMLLTNLMMSIMLMIMLNMMFFMY
uniref:NADH-ubiquinone oxidoreductase chain 2 n=1 Tax=Pseudoneureclipsis achim TaxID=623285 RepID=A0A9E8LP92_9NEOP|nr:NADH dehydrogenase subunit 2 [Pseudoneureclipsis achim]UZZ44273.1 NADH dehydrogenase subunit 2 [Pseudoneureclipsis achim]